MLTVAGSQQRRKNLWAQIPESIDWVLVGDSRHIQYFANFRINPLSFSADQQALLLLHRNGEAVLLADNFVRRTAVCDPVVDREVIIPWYTHRTSIANRGLVLVEALQQCRSEWADSAGLIETEAVSDVVARTVAGNVSWQISDGRTVGDIVRTLRRQKLPDEVALLRRCMAAGDAGHKAAFEMIRPGVTELDVFLAIQQAAQRNAGCACVVYGDFRATNAVQFKAGGLPTDYVLQDGDLFIADFSVIINGYRSDFTNTMAVGAPTDAQTRQAETCREAMLAAEATLKAGAAGRAVYQAASAVLMAHDYPALGHHCGHGLGMEHPEAPILVPDSDDVLMAGDVVTIEPGLYIEGVGGMRFEHNYLITENGFDRLSDHHIGLTW